MHMRAQMLRIEQEKVLMQNRLEEETAEREKAQKQVGPCWLFLGLQGGRRLVVVAAPVGTYCPRAHVVAVGSVSHGGRQTALAAALTRAQVEVAKKIMMGSTAAAAPAAGKTEAAATRKGRGSRRETWCPGRSAWEAPAQGAWWRGRSCVLWCCGARHVRRGLTAPAPRRTSHIHTPTPLCPTAAQPLRTPRGASGPRRATACCCRPCSRATRMAQGRASACASATRGVRRAADGGGVGVAYICMRGAWARGRAAVKPWR